MTTKSNVEAKLVALCVDVLNLQEITGENSLSQYSVQPDALRFLLQALSDFLDFDFDTAEFTMETTLSAIAQHVVTQIDAKINHP